MLKRIAIITWYDYQNYGTALQAVALNGAIRKLGYEALDIKYDPRPFQSYRSNTKTKLSQRLIGKIDLIHGLIPVSRPERDSAFSSFLNTNLPLTPESLTYSTCPADLTSLYDAFVCGSDQVWSPRCFDPRYYLDFVVDNHKKIAYAPSFGCESIDSFDDADDIKRLVCQFYALSVREKTGADIVESIVGLRPPVVVDPTMLLKPEDWAALARPYPVHGQAYCLFYFLGRDPCNLKAAYRIAAKRGLRVAKIPVFERQLEEPDSVGAGIGPAEFIDLIRNASMVCTDSFHGMVFSTIFKRPFVAFERFDSQKSNSQNTRIYNFLQMTRQEDVLLSRSEISRGHFDRFFIPLDVNAFGELDSLRSDSLKYLSDSLLAATGGDC